MGHGSCLAACAGTCGVRLVITIQNYDIGKVGADQLCEEQDCSGMAIRQPRNEALVCYLPPLRWGIHVDV
jgi:hypothetical protein